MSGCAIRARGCAIRSSLREFDYMTTATTDIFVMIYSDEHNIVTVSVGTVTASINHRLN